MAKDDEILSCFMALRKMSYIFLLLYLRIIYRSCEICFVIPYLAMHDLGLWRCIYIKDNKLEWMWYLY